MVVRFLAPRVSSSGSKPGVKLSSTEEVMGLNLLSPLGVREYLPLGCVFIPSRKNKICLTHTVSPEIQLDLVHPSCLARAATFHFGSLTETETTSFGLRLTQDAPILYLESIVPTTLAFFT
jgi:hypothetical protein